MPRISYIGPGSSAAPAPSKEKQRVRVRVSRRDKYNNNNNNHYNPPQPAPNPREDANIQLAPANTHTQPNTVAAGLTAAGAMATAVAAAAQGNSHAQPTPAQEQYPDTGYYPGDLQYPALAQQYQPFLNNNPTPAMASRGEPVPYNPYQLQQQQQLLQQWQPGQPFPAYPRSQGVLTSARQPLPLDTQYPPAGMAPMVQPPLPPQNYINPTQNTNPWPYSNNYLQPPPLVPPYFFQQPQPLPYLPNPNNLMRVQSLNNNPRAKGKHTTGKQQQRRRRRHSRSDDSDADTDRPSSSTSHSSAGGTSNSSGDQNPEQPKGLVARILGTIAPWYGFPVNDSLPQRGPVLIPSSLDEPDILAHRDGQRVYQEAQTKTLFGKFVNIPQNYRFVEEADGQFIRVLDPGRRYVPMGREIGFVHNISIQHIAFPFLCFDKDLAPTTVIIHLLVKVEDPAAASYYVQFPRKTMMLIAQWEVRTAISRVPVQISLERVSDIGRHCQIVVNATARAWGFRCIRVLLDIMPSPSTVEQMRGFSEYRRVAQIQELQVRTQGHINAIRQQQHLFLQDRENRAQDREEIFRTQAILAQKSMAAEEEIRNIREYEETALGQHVFRHRLQQQMYEQGIAEDHGEGPLLVEHPDGPVFGMPHPADSIHPAAEYGVFETAHPHPHHPGMPPPAIIHPALSGHPIPLGAAPMVSFHPSTLSVHPGVSPSHPITPGMPRPLPSFRGPPMHPEEVEAFEMSHFEGDHPDELDPRDMMRLAAEEHLEEIEGRHMMRLAAEEHLEEMEGRHMDPVGFHQHDLNIAMHHEDMNPPLSIHHHPSGELSVQGPDGSIYEVNLPPIAMASESFSDPRSSFLAEMERRELDPRSYESRSVHAP